MWKRMKEGQFEFDEDKDAVLLQCERIGAFEIALEQLKLHRADVHGKKRSYTTG